MTADLDLSELALSIGDATRIRMLALLMEGRALTAKELAYGAGVKPATASAHLRRLQGDQLIDVAAEGRYKYFRLASPDVAQLVESLMVVAWRRPSPGAGKRPTGPICVARFCYDHLAGRLGTRITEAMVARGLLVGGDKAFSVTGDGHAFLQTLGIEVSTLQRGRRKLAYPCLDWTERRHHLAGAVGAALATRMLALGWLTAQKHSRVLTITKSGEAGLAERFGLATLG